jgi:hypothetical protein
MSRACLGADPRHVDTPSTSLIRVAPRCARISTRRPAKGYLVITGGAPDYKNFLALAGGKDAQPLHAHDPLLLLFRRSCPR